MWPVWSRALAELGDHYSEWKPSPSDCKDLLREAERLLPLERARLAIAPETFVLKQLARLALDKAMHELSPKALKARYHDLVSLLRFPADIWVEGVETIMKTSSFFPRINELYCVMAPLLRERENRIARLEAIIRRAKEPASRERPRSPPTAEEIAAVAAKVAEAKRILTRGMEEGDDTRAETPHQAAPRQHDDAAGDPAPGAPSRAPGE